MNYLSVLFSPLGFLGASLIQKLKPSASIVAYSSLLPFLGDLKEEGRKESLGLQGLDLDPEFGSPFRVIEGIKSLLSPFFI